MMSAIVEFPLDRARGPRELKQGIRPADIVIFPGVRIERRDVGLPDRGNENLQPLCGASSPVAVEE